MARVGTIYQKAIDSFITIGDTNHTHCDVLCLSDGTILEYSGANIYYFGTSRIWTSLPSGYSRVSTGGSYNQCERATVWGEKIYLMGINGGVCKVWSLDIATKVFTALKTWTASGAYTWGILLGPWRGNGQYGAIGVMYADAGGTHCRLESLLLSDGTITHLIDYNATLGEFFADSALLSGYLRCGDNDVVYVSSADIYGSNNRYYRSSPLSSWTPTLIDSNLGTAYYYIPSNDEGYHVRSNSLTTFYNQARSTSWTLPAAYRDGIKLGLDGTSMIWMFQLTNGIYVASLPSGGGAITYTKLTSHSLYVDPCRSWSGFCCLGKGAAISNTEPSAFITQVKLSTGYSTLYRSDLWRQSLE